MTGLLQMLLKLQLLQMKLLQRNLHQRSLNLRSLQHHSLCSLKRCLRNSLHSAILRQSILRSLSLLRRPSQLSQCLLRLNSLLLDSSAINLDRANLQTVIPRPVILPTFPVQDNLRTEKIPKASLVSARDSNGFSFCLSRWYIQEELYC